MKKYDNAFTRSFTYFPFKLPGVFSAKRSLHNKVGIGSRVVSLNTGTIVNRSITPVKSLNFP